MKTRVAHVFMRWNSWMDDTASVKAWWRTLCMELNLTFCAAFHYKFSPQGTTHVCVIGESHVTLHTWPELGYAELTLHSCKRFDYSKLVAQLKLVTPELLSHRMTIVEHPPTADQ